MNLLDAARQALPGLDWKEDDACVLAVVARVFIDPVGIGMIKGGKWVAWSGSDGPTYDTPEAAAQWLRAQIEARRDVLDAALGDSQWARVAELEKAATDWLTMYGIAAARADAAEAKLKALAGLVAKWDDGTHGCEVDEWGRLLPCPQCDEEDYARAEARRLVGVNNG